MPNASRLRLLDVDPELARAVPESDHAAAAAHVVAIGLDLRRGSFDPLDMRAHLPSCVGMLVLEGIVARETTIDDRPSRQLLGAGDVLLEDRPPDGGLVAASVEWAVVSSARIALLGESWVRATAHWPALATELLARAGRQAARAAVHQAICTLPNVEDRVRMLLLHLAERWGRFGADGVMLPLRLTHEELGRLVGARRPTVTLALQELARRGELERREDGAWLMQLARGGDLSAPEPRRLRPPAEALGSTDFVTTELTERLAALEREIAG